MTKDGERRLASKQDLFVDPDSLPVKRRGQQREAQGGV
jgi:hypothetical protein